MPTRRSIAIARRRFSALLGRARYWTSIACVAIVSTGLSAVIGSWNPMAMRSPRSRRSSPEPRFRTSWPSNTICPLRISALSASSLITAEISVVLPQPGIEHVAQRLAEEGEAKRAQHQRDAGRDHQPRRVADEGIAVVQNVAPGRRRRAHAKPEERQARL